MLRSGKYVGRAGFERSSARMQRMIIDTNVYIDWINDGKYEAVIFNATPLST
jgi:hypothetical protein